MLVVLNSTQDEHGRVQVAYAGRGVSNGRRARRAVRVLLAEYDIASGRKRKIAHGLLVRAVRLKQAFGALRTLAQVEIEQAVHDGRKDSGRPTKKALAARARGAR